MNWDFPGEPWCITIPRLDKRRLVFDKLWKGQVKFHRGVDYLDVDLDKLLERYDKTPMFRYLNQPQLAMYFGHLTLWLKLLDGVGDRWVIFEDDAMPTGSKFQHIDGELVRYFKPSSEWPYWASALCVCVTRKFLQDLVWCNMAASPDRVIKSVENHDPIFPTEFPVEGNPEFKCSYDPHVMWDTTEPYIPL